MKSYLDSPQYRAMMQQALSPGQATGPGGGMANAAQQMAAAFMANRMEQKGQAREDDYNKALAGALQLQPTDYTGVTPRIGAAGPNDSVQSRQAAGAYDNQIPEVPLLAKLLQTGNADVTQDFLPQAVQQQAQASQPITPYQRATLGQSAEDNKRAMAQFLMGQEGLNARQDKTLAAQSENTATTRDAANAYRSATLAQGERRIAISEQNATNRNQISPRQQLMASIQLRKELDQNPDAKAFNEVAANYDVIGKIASAPPTAQNDIALIFSYMKMLDPGSVVREGEFANAQNSAGIPEQIYNTYNKALNGQRLNPDQRQQFTGTAQRLYESRKTRYDQLVQQYQGYAHEGGLSDATIQPRIPVGQAQPQPQAAPQPQGQGMAPPQASSAQQMPPVFRYDRQGNRLP